MAEILFCGGCGKKGMLEVWKHCPHCGFKVLVPEIVCQFPGLPKGQLPEGWNPLFLKSGDIAEALIDSGFASSRLELADPDWDDAWVEEFNHDHFGVVYVVKEDGNARFSLDLMITGLPLAEQLKEKFEDLENPLVRLVDDGWCIELNSFGGAWQDEESYAKVLQENFGGEILIAKPKKKK